MMLRLMMLAIVIKTEWSEANISSNVNMVTMMTLLMMEMILVALVQMQSAQTFGKGGADDALKRDATNKDGRSHS